MCGFLGEITNNLIEKEIFHDLLDLSIHRGPDQQGYWKDDFCQLGFNRLSILDLSEKGSQPILSPSGKFAMVFNGEIYNYREIQKKFSISNNVLRSSSDTEILSHLLEKVSIIDFAKELNGMFAIAVWDLEKKQLHLIRDFAGIKPLFYGIYNHGIVFASQFDQIFLHPAFQNKKLRPEIMKEYFGLGYMHAPNTVFENIFQIEVGQIVSWDYQNLKIVSKTKYFDWKIADQLKETSSETVSKFDEIFSKVIKNQLNADVPVSTFLSGGIDSPLVTAFSKKYRKDIEVFTFGINDLEFNESDVAQKIAKKLNVKQNIELISENELVKIIDLHFEKMSEPFGDASSVPTFVITKKAKKYATVMLSGDGGDELFWGYPRFLKSIQHLKWFYLHLSIRKIVAPFYRKFFKKTSSAIDVFSDFDQWILSKQLHFPNLDYVFPNIKFSPELLESYSLKEKLNKKNVLNFLKQNEFNAHLQKILRKVDLMSMANSLEVRVPFLDKNTIDFSNTIIPEFGILHQIPKLILRKSLSNYIDKEIINLPKKGFSVPVEKWLRNELKSDLIFNLQEKTFYGSEFLDKNELDLVINNFLNHDPNSNPWAIWHLYTWQKWASKYKLKSNI